MYHLASPRDMELQLLVMRSQQTSPERRRIAAETDNKMDFILTFGANSSDEDDSEEEDDNDDEEEEEEEEDGNSD